MPRWRDDFQPRWSPDGTRIVFTSEGGGYSDIYVMNCDGSDRQQLTSHPAYDSGGDWSPDSEQIVFDSQRSGNPDIYIMNADGTNIHNLTNTSVMEISPKWSPLGDRIAFQKIADDNWEIFTFDTTGGDLQRLTYTERDDQQVDWSPDATMLVYQTRRDPGPYHDIFMMNADGSNQERLTDNSAQDWYAAWVPLPPASVRPLPDSADAVLLRAVPNPCRGRLEICFELRRGTAVRVQILDVAGRLVREVGHGFKGAGRHVIAWSGCDANGSPMPSGTYYCRLGASNQVRGKPVVWIR